MARRVFISFRYLDGNTYKEKLEKIFDNSTMVINCSEDQDRSNMSESTIQKYLYDKLKSTSVTIVLITPKAVTHHRGWYGYDDWMYDEIRYSLEERENNRCNGLIAVYTKEAESQLFCRKTHICDICKQESSVLSMNNIDNLCRENMMNIRPEYKRNKCAGVYDSDHDSYCSFVAWDDFVKDYARYIDCAVEKREHLYKYKITKRL